MDSTAPDFVLYKNGTCNFCSDFFEKNPQGTHHLKDPPSTENLIRQIREHGKGKKYDCVVGMSGGVDSAYTLLLAKESGLHPIAVHLDNGWNSELAVKNIETVTKVLKVDLHTHVIDWNEFRDLQLSFLKSHVVDIELLTDNAMLATNYLAAKKFGVKYILAGTNQSTEGVRMPVGWNHFKLDSRNIQSIQKSFGNIKIRTFPLISPFSYLRFKSIDRISWVSFLDYFDYKKEVALKELSELGFRPYPYKHYESVFTRFYQGYLLPKKFGIDKRKVHFSSLICSGQLSRQKALEKLQESPYESPDILNEDKAFFLKKMGLKENDLEAYLNTPAVAHTHYPSWLPLWKSLQTAKKFFLPKKKFPKDTSSSVSIVILSPSVGGSERRMLEMLETLLSQPSETRFQLITTAGVLRVIRQSGYSIPENALIILKGHRALINYIEIVKIAWKTRNTNTAFHYFFNFPPLIHTLCRQRTILSHTNTALFSEIVPSKKFRWLFWWCSLECTVLEVLDPNVFQILSSKSWIRSKIFLTPASFISLNKYSVGTQKTNEVLFCGKFNSDDSKGAWRFIKALPKIHQTVQESGISDATYLLIGDGPLRNTIQQESLKLNHQGIQVSLEQTSTPGARMRQAKVFLSLQKKSNYPSRSLLEAMASGALPIINDSGDSRKMGEELFAKFISEDFSEAELANAIVDVLKLSENERAIRVTQMRSFLEKRFNPTQHHNHYLALYQVKPLLADIRKAS